MVFCRDAENERPPLSLILPHLYLGAERDVTQVNHWFFLLSFPSQNAVGVVM